MSAGVISGHRVRFAPRLLYPFRQRDPGVRFVPEADIHLREPRLENQELARSPSASAIHAAP
jgi:hypothetical protein